MAERERIKHGDEPSREFRAIDEMCLPHSSVWQSASKDAIKYLDSEAKEPPNLVVKKHCILRLTANIGSLCQGNVCILAELPQPTDASILVYIAPSRKRGW